MFLVVVVVKYFVQEGMPQGKDGKDAQSGRGGAKGHVVGARLINVSVEWKRKRGQRQGPHHRTEYV